MNRKTPSKIKFFPSIKGQEQNERGLASQGKIFFIGIAGRKFKGFPHVLIIAIP
jgi:hypothetical protein